MSSGAYVEPPIFRAGVSAERLKYPISHVSLSFGCVVICFPGQTKPRLKISVGWHRAFFQNHHVGFTVYESRLSGAIQTIDEAVCLVTHHLPASEQRMRQALRRGTLPGKFTHWLHQRMRRVPPAEIWPLQGGRIRGLPNVHTFPATHDVQQSPKAS